MEEEEEKIPARKDAESATAADLQANIGMNTAAIETTEQNTQAQVKTAAIACDPREIEVSDVAMQFMPKTNEQSCDPKVFPQMEIGCQSEAGRDEEGQVAMDGIVCFKCEGSRVSKKGAPCKRCNGTGQVDGAFMKLVMDVVREEIHTFAPKLFSDLLKES